MDLVVVPDLGRLGCFIQIPEFQQGSTALCPAELAAVTAARQATVEETTVFCQAWWSASHFNSLGNFYSANTGQLLSSVFEANPPLASLGPQPG